MPSVFAWGPSAQAQGGWHFGIWAPGSSKVDITVSDRSHVADHVGDGWFTAQITGMPGDIYTLRVDGVEIIDPAARWMDSLSGPTRLTGRLRRPRSGPARSWEEAVILEIHIGTFTAEGTFAAAASRMAEIAQLGITAVEFMPVNMFPGQRGWGYDPAFPFAPHPAYGTPADLAALIDAVHDAGMLAILDVVYNHFGPEGVSLSSVAPAFFDPDHRTPWGPRIKYDAVQVRDYFIENARMWVLDYGFDGLRLDAVHQIHDPSEPHLVDRIARALRAAPDRAVFLIAEDERNLPDHRDEGTITANWNDDYHHAVHCLLTGEDESYYANFAVDPLGDLARALAEGHVEQGQPRAAQDAPRGAPVDHLSPVHFINANQTHDQVGNRARGERLISLTSPDAARIAHALLLCSPAIPMLFMGEEEGARAPFLFFADYDGAMADAIRQGRAREFARFSQFGGPVPDPMADDTFAASRPYAKPAADARQWRDMTRLCLTFRTAAVVPLLRSGEAAMPSVRRIGSCALHARWHFNAGTLESVVHFGTAADEAVTFADPGLQIGAAKDPYYFATRVVAP